MHSPTASTQPAICATLYPSVQHHLEIDSSDVLYLAVGGDGIKTVSTSGTDIGGWTSSALGCDVRALAWDATGKLHMGALGAMLLLRFRACIECLRLSDGRRQACEPQRWSAGRRDWRLAASSSPRCCSLCATSGRQQLGTSAAQVCGQA